MIPVLFVGAHVSLQSEWHWPDQRILLIGFFRHFLWLIAVLKALEFGFSARSAELIVAMQPVLTALIVTYLLVERDHLYQWIGVVVSILSFFWMLHLNRARNAARVSSLQYFAPPVTMLIAWPVFGEALSLLGFMGLFITAGGFFLIHRGEQALAEQNG